MSKSPYEILKIPPTSSQEEIKRAHRALAKKYHPDMYKDNPLVDLANERMQEINDAYRKLSNLQTIQKTTKDMGNKENQSKQSDWQQDNQQRFEGIYQQALRKKNKAQTETDFEEAAVLFRSVSSYKDASYFATECDDLAKKTHIKKETYRKALLKKDKGQSETDFKEAASLFRSVSGYKDSYLLAVECDDLAKKAQLKLTQEIYQRALLKKKNGQTETDFVEAAALFRSISGYEDSFLATECDGLAKKAHLKEKQVTYQKALKKMKNGQSEIDFVEAADLFKNIPGYMNSNSYMDSCYSRALHFRDAQNRTEHMNKTEHENRSKKNTIRRVKINSILREFWVYLIFIAIILIALVVGYLNTL